jgi:hypothetical protein
MIMELLQLLNRVVGNIALILTFSLWAYLTIRSWGAPVARALMIMLFGVFTAVAADVLVRDARDPRIVEDILRWCWIGIVLVPTSMLHMVLALARQLQIRAQLPLAHHCDIPDGCDNCAVGRCI